MLIPYLLAFAGFQYLHIWLHEIGHAVAGRSVGYDVTSLGTGTGKPLFTWTWNGMRFFICRENIFSGVTFLFSDGVSPTRKGELLIHFGGIIANFVTACLLGVILYFSPGSTYCWISLGAACLCLVCSIIPLRGLSGSYAEQNDGATIFDHFWPRKSTRVALSREDLKQGLDMIQFLNGIGDHRGVYHYAKFVAPALLRFGDIESARSLMPLMGAAGRSTPKYRLEYALLRASVEIYAEDGGEAGEALDEADALYSGAKGDDHWVQLRWDRFRWLLMMKQPAEALEIIDELRAQYPIDTDERMAVTLLTCRLCAILDLHGLEEGQKAYEEYQRLNIHSPSDRLDLNVAHVMGKAYTKNENWLGSEPYFRMALKLATKLGYVPSGSADLIEDADACFEHLGFSNDPAIAELKQSLSKVQRKQQMIVQKEAHQEFLLRRISEFGIGCVLWSLLIFAVAGQSGAGIDFGSLLSKFSLAAVFGIVIAWGFGYSMREFRPFAAFVIVLLTVLPWAGAAAIAFAH
ncbi:MAG: site-2 protease family protein [Capsulimonas sp.]|uniref:site-2 protease family protein n=1 Tax=Capsulimonas sp. TaxID=2494211 RepID=UPI0032650A18